VNYSMRRSCSNVNEDLTTLNELAEHIRQEWTIVSGAPASIVVLFVLAFGAVLVRCVQVGLWQNYRRIERKAYGQG
jgi:hypothetical protein